MAKLVKLALYAFALVGLLVSAASGYIYATNTELVKEFWNVREDVRALPDERRLEVVAELPARIKFEREVREDMKTLPVERQLELYQQLESSRDQVFEQFKQRIHAEAEISRKARDAKDATKQITEKLGKVSVGFDLKGGAKAAPTPRPDALARVEGARTGVADARDGFNASRSSSDKRQRVDAAVAMLDALDKLGDEIGKTKAGTMSVDEKQRLNNIVRDARELFIIARQTPGLDEDVRAKPLLASIPANLQS